jgi:hypothetical protein
MLLGTMLTALDELRDLSVEVEEGVNPVENGLVRVIAGTAFAREGEVEEALETLGADLNVQNLDAYVSLHSEIRRRCHTFLSVSLIVKSTFR